MYGLVNQAIQGLITDNYGADTWSKIKEKAGVKEEIFLSNEIYDDSITYNLAGSASEVLEMPVGDILHTFGKYWVLKVGAQKYGALMSAGGNTLEEFLMNLPGFHSRVMLIYSDIKPPEFKIIKKDNNVLLLHYFSKRKGLTMFVHGLIDGLAEMFKTKAGVTHIGSEPGTETHDVFEILISE
jgi:hypothetical protein